MTLHRSLLFRLSGAWWLWTGTPWESQARRLLLALAAHDGEQIRVESLRG